MKKLGKKSDVKMIRVRPEKLAEVTGGGRVNCAIECAADCGAVECAAVHCSTR
jgi:hypothetical protein